MDLVDLRFPQEVAAEGLEADTLIRLEARDPEGPQVDVLAGPVAVRHEVVQVLGLLVPVPRVAEDMSRERPERMWSEIRREVVRRFVRDHQRVVVSGFR